jgi:hypothetical protein
MDSEGLEELIAYTEASNTLKNMKNDKNPGSSEYLSPRQRSCEGI